MWIPALFLLASSGFFGLVPGVKGGTELDDVFEGRLRNISVYEGEDATFECNVLQNMGVIGWHHKLKTHTVYRNGTQDGKAMSMNVDETKYRHSEFVSPTGIHRLTILNVTAADRGWVDCHAWVSRTELLDGVGFKVNTGGYLNVLLPPREVAVVASGHQTKHGAAQYRMGEMVNLTCVASSGNPNPILVWLRGSQRIDADKKYSFKRWEDGEATYNSLLFTADPTDHEATFTCQAEGVAIRKQIAHSYVRSIGLIVEYPPEAPVIESVAHDGDVLKVRANVPVRLTCKSSHGNPRPKLTWFKNDVEVESYDSRQGMPGLEAAAVLDFTPRPIDNGAVMKCEATNNLMPRGVGVKTILDVQYGPTDAVLDGPEEIQPKALLTLTCTSAPSNPPAKIIWSLKDKNGARTFHVKGKENRDEHGGFRTTSSIEVNFRNGWDTEVFCEARNSETPDFVRRSKRLRGVPPPPAGSADPEGFSGSSFEVFVNGIPQQPSNETALYEMSELSGADGNMTTIIAAAVSVAGVVVIALIACSVFMFVRSKNRKFEEMANSDSSDSSKGQTEVCSQNGIDARTDTTGSDIEKNTADLYSQVTPKKMLSPSMIRTQAVSTYLFDDNYDNRSGNYRHWNAPEPGGDSDMGVDYEAEYIEALRRSAMQTMMPHAHSPSPLRPVPNHITYDPIYKGGLMSTFQGQQLYPNYRAETSVDELRGHLV